MSLRMEMDLGVGDGFEGARWVWGREMGWGGIWVWGWRRLTRWRDTPLNSGVHTDTRTHRRTHKSKNTIRQFHYVHLADIINFQSPNWLYSSTSSSCCSTVCGGGGSSSRRIGGGCWNSRSSSSGGGHGMLRPATEATWRPKMNRSFRVQQLRVAVLDVYRKSCTYIQHKIHNILYVQAQY